MLYNLLFPLSESIGFFNIFQYLTFRAGAAIVTALVVSFLVGPVLIRTLRARQGKGQPIREDGPESHLKTKQGTPTMGGFLILLGVLSGTLLWADLTNVYVWIILFVTFGFGAVGFVDDYMKLRSRSTKGFPTTAWRCPSSRRCWSISAGFSCPSSPSSWSAPPIRSISPTGWTAWPSCPS